MAWPNNAISPSLLIAVAHIMPSPTCVGTIPERDLPNVEIETYPTIRIAKPKNTMISMLSNAANRSMKPPRREEISSQTPSG